MLWAQLENDVEFTKSLNPFFLLAITLTKKKSKLDVLGFLLQEGLCHIDGFCQSTASKECFGAVQARFRLDQGKSALLS